MLCVVLCTNNVHTFLTETMTTEHGCMWRCGNKFKRKSNTTLHHLDVGLPIQKEILSLCTYITYNAINTAGNAKCFIYECLNWKITSRKYLDFLLLHMFVYEDNSDSIFLWKKFIFPKYKVQKEILFFSFPLRENAKKRNDNI